jgi:hypothetical protein
MVDKEDDDLDIPPTTAADWIGAVKVFPGDPPRVPLPGGMTFHVFRSSADPNWFVVTGHAEASGLPPCPGGGSWIYFQAFPELGRPRVGFSESEAKADIAAKGYHMRNMNAVVTTAE